VVLRKCRDWASEIGEIKITEDQNPIISIQVTGVDIEPILRAAEANDNAGNRRKRIREALFKELERSNVTRDRTDSIFSSPSMQKRLQAIFPDQASFREFQKNLVVEAKMADTRKAMQGNSTTAKQLMEGLGAGKPSRLVIGRWKKHGS
jgi:hypothetical protein